MPMDGDERMVETDIWAPVCTYREREMGGGGGMVTYIISRHNKDREAV